MTTSNLKIYRLRPQSPLEIAFFRSWWVIMFSLLCLLFYEQGKKSRMEFFQSLQGRLATFHEEKKSALKLKEELMLTINSQSDPAFVELTLMKVLGVVPEGETKVYFINP